MSGNWKQEGDWPNPWTWGIDENGQWKKIANPLFREVAMHDATVASTSDNIVDIGTAASDKGKGKNGKDGNDGQA